MKWAQPEIVGGDINSRKAAELEKVRQAPDAGGPDTRYPGAKRKMFNLNSGAHNILNQLGIVGTV
jgi:hypothetical protein